jgi:S1-C subfamily serine protease
MNSGRRIGIGVTSLTKQLSDHFGVDGGVMVTDVRPDSPAAKAGLKAGDIIVGVEGKDVKSDVDLIRAVNEKKDGDVSLTFIRDGNRQTISVTPEKADSNLSGFFESPDAPGASMAPQQFKFAVPPAPIPMSEFGFPRRVL